MWSQQGVTTMNDQPVSRSEAVFHSLRARSHYESLQNWHGKGKHITKLRIRSALLGIKNLEIQEKDIMP